MKPAKTPLVPEETARPRKPGRRPRSAHGAPTPSRTAIIQCAIDLARRESISEVSMVRVGREMDVAAGLVHYYVGSKDDLLSAVINHAFKERMNAMPAPTGDWRTDLAGIARSVLKATSEWPGLGTYIMTQNRFRLFQRVEAGEEDYGLTFLNHVGTVLRDSGFPASKAALVYHLLMTFVMSVAVERELGQAPGTHEDFIVKYVAQSDGASVPGATFIVGAFSKLSSETTFETGLTIMLDGFESWRSPAAVRRAK